MPTRGMRRLSGVAGTVMLATILVACAGTPNTPPSAGSGLQQSAPPSSSTAAPTPTADPVALKANVKNGASKVKVDTLVSVSASAGTLTKATLSYTNRDRQGRTQRGTVAGKINKDRTRWTAIDRLEPAAAYQLISVGKNHVNQPSTVKTTFRTQNLHWPSKPIPRSIPSKAARWASVCL